MQHARKAYVPVLDWDMLFDSEQFVVCHIPFKLRGIKATGFEIVDKINYKEVFLVNDFARQFNLNLDRWKIDIPSEEDVHIVLRGWTILGQLPLCAH